MAEVLRPGDTMDAVAENPSSDGQIMDGIGAVIPHLQLPDEEGATSAAAQDTSRTARAMQATPPHLSQDPGIASHRQFRDDVFGERPRTTLDSDGVAKRSSLAPLDPLDNEDEDEEDQVEEEHEVPEQARERPAVESKMVSFARAPLAIEAADRGGASPVSPNSRVPPGALKTARSNRFFSRIKSHGSPSSLSPGSTLRSSPFSLRTDSSNYGPSSPSATRHGRKGSEGGDNDADTEDQTDDEATQAGRRSPKRRRVLTSSASAGPSTPRAFAFPERSQGLPSSSEPRRFRPVRSSTANDAYESAIQGVSEDEGRSRLAGPAQQWRRRSSAWVDTIRHPSSNTARRNSEQGSIAGPSRPRNLRRSTAAAGIPLSATDGEASPSAWRLRREPAARKWRELKAGLKFMGQKKKDAVSQIDQDKSTELVAQLLAGSPAAIILASHFSGDERDHKRIPALLEQLKINIVDSQYNEESGPNRNVNFKIDMEYGSGMMRMKWTIQRSMRDFWRLHTRFGAQVAFSKIHRRKDAGQKVKIPRFPRSAFPFAKEFTGEDFADMEEDEEAVEEPCDAREPPTPMTPLPERPGKHHRGTSWMHVRQHSSTGGVEGAAVSSTDQPGVGSEAQANTSGRRSARLAERQKRKLEAYLRGLIKYVMFRPGSNRLCRFLELSALGIKLAVEGGYHGKEGTLTIQSGKGLDFRRAWTPNLLLQRHRPMWFLVRHSYVVCVDSPEDMNIYDVFLVDKDFVVTPKRGKLRDQTSAKDLAKTAGHAARHPQHHILRVANSERKLRLLAKNEDQLSQFQASLKIMAGATPWSKKHRFDSFAPVRENIFAQWLVDARDYMWNVSRALENARDVIYIHDWWLSPELYLRRPGAISQKWRLDRILKRKAEQGVKIFVILYRNIESAIPIDSEYTKFALLDLHPNIFVQRSPNQYREAVFFWAHHEKLVIVDHIIAFCGGVDLCFGRWDSPDHRLVDDRPTGWEGSDMSLNADTCQMWPGKDYSNPRVRDFFALNEPFEEMYDRTKVARMPWHDVGMQMVGQTARDLTRHFVQRWNFLLRQRKTSRPTPFLLPPPDFSPSDTESLGLEGTCSVQILRSACEWSIGTPGQTEHSILNAYCKLIQTSEHFVYIENQFFISSSTMEATRMRNGVGDALVERVKLAHERGDDWSAVILIPLMPGFQNTVDAPNGTSIRLIMQCQYHSICRGETSIFGRLKAVGINPHKYIKFYSLRTWAKIGSAKALVTEQLYIHAKIMVVDDRYAIIGSANINERSLLGDRDSELASIVFDNDMIDSTMGGRPYKVGRFPHTFRVRLMREHLGIDVDHVGDEALEDGFDDDDDWDEDDHRSRSVSDPSSKRTLTDEEVYTLPRDLSITIPDVHTFNHDADAAQENNPHLKRRKAPTRDGRVTGTEAHKRDVEGYGVDNMHDLEDRPGAHGRDSVLLRGGREVLVDSAELDRKGSVKNPARRKERSDMPQLYSLPSSTSTKAPLPPAGPQRLQSMDMGLTLRSQLPPLPTTDDTDIGGPPLQQTNTKASLDSLNPVLAGMRRPVVEPNCMKDPLNPSFLRDTWQKVAENNTLLYRRVFKCMPDAQVTNWAQYNAAVAFGEQFAHSQGMDKSSMKMQQEAGGKTGPPGHDQAGLAAAAGAVLAGGSSAKGLSEKVSPSSHRQDSHNEARSDSHEIISEKETVQQDGPRPAGYSPTDTLNEKDDRSASTPDEAQTGVNEEQTPPLRDRTNVSDGTNEKEIHPDGDAANDGSQRRRRRTTAKASGAAKFESILSKPDAEKMMQLVQGNLVEWPYEWLSQEEKGGKWLYAVDQMSPIEIYD